MNKYNIKLTTFFSILVTVVLLSSCKKDFQLSKPTFWPVIKLNGPETVTIKVGDVYTDQSAVVTVNGAAIDFDTQSDVDNTTEGVYSVNYSAANEDGIKATQTRLVVVVPAEAVDVDGLEGDFTLTTPSRPAPVPTMNISSLGAGSHAYISTNIYGSNGSNTVLVRPAYFYSLDGLTMEILSGPYVAANAFSDGGSATWNPATKKLAASFLLGHDAPGTTFNRTWTQN